MRFLCEIIHTVKFVNLDYDFKLWLYSNKPNELIMR